MAVNDGGDVVNVSIHSNGIEMDQKSKENDQNNNLMKLGKYVLVVMMPFLFYRHRPL